ncbi:cobalamin-binding protein [Thalassotalea psychrophila]|uniref:Cobalamin-binding protein n=1 Tax=Thalassotalea psychrophila TaxID=3065647 RepID=A0ABY9TPV2_9GAMM|nr:cobalamin-binding protein [Colwelliaceae bacterium SQ149]
MNKKHKTLVVFISLIIVAWLLKVIFITSTVVVSEVAEVIKDEQKEVQEQQDANKYYSQQKIIALAPHVVEVLFDLGVGSKIVATTEHSDFPEQANSIPRVGNYARLKIEKILAYQPDLIIAWRTGNPSDDLERLEQLGLNVVYSDPINLTDIAKELRLFGKLTGSSEIAEQKALDFERKITALTQQYQNKQPISVFYELWSKPLTTVAQNAWPQQHLEVCGAINPFKQLINDYPQINIEQIIIANPELIIQPMSAGEPNPDAVDWQKFPQVTAAQHKQLLMPNSDILHRMSFRLLSELEQLCIDIDSSRNFYQSLQN